MRTRIIDWSRHQGVTNLQAVRTRWGIIMLMARCTIGWSYKDPHYINNFRQAIAIKNAFPNDEFWFVAYHVLWPWNRDPLREVGWFLENIEVDGILPDFLVDDLELPNSTDGWASLTPSSVADQIETQLPAIEQRSGLSVATYTGSWWWNSSRHIGSVTPIGIEQDFPLIEAEYITPAWKVGRVDFSEEPADDRFPISLGRGWTLEDLLSWQWTSGLIPEGVQSASQDGQSLMWTLEKLREWAGKDTTEPPLTYEQKTDILWEAHPELHP